MTHPHFLVIGAQRCATTWLHTVLEAHPQIAMARPARPEPKVFLSDERSAEGLRAYERSYFAHAAPGQVLGEKSTSYLEDPRAARRAAAVLGTADILVLLRNPVERAVSHWRFSTDNGLEHRPLAEALLADLEGSSPAWDPRITSVSPYAYVRRGRYAEDLPAWLEAFPDRVHVLLTEIVAGDPAGEAEVYRAVGLGPPSRPTRHPRSPRGAVNASRVPAPEVPRWLRARLRDHYAASDEALRDLLGRELPWRVADRAGVGGDPR